jgi:hypothetical protein
MAYLDDRVLDSGLTVLDTEVNSLHICSQEPTTYTQAVTTYSWFTNCANANWT